MRQNATIKAKMQTDSSIAHRAIAMRIPSDLLAEGAEDQREVDDPLEGEDQTPLLLVYMAAFHDEGHPSERGDVLQRIAVERDQIRFVSRRDASHTITEAERFRRQ